MDEQVIITLAGIVLLAIGCQWLGWFVKLPAILFLLLAGILVGPVFNLLNPEELFGGLMFPMVSLAVAVILFEGGLSLKFHEIKGIGNVVRNLVTVGVLITWLITSFFTNLVLGFSIELSLLFGAITVVTGPTVIVPMLRTVRPNVRISNILRWEGIVIDPIGAILAVLVFDFVLSGQSGHSWGHTFISLAKIIITGLIIGVSGGYAFGEILKKHWMPEYLHNVATLALVLGVFVFSNVAMEESGLLAVTVMGLWLANMKDAPVDEILDFKESLSVLLISVLFIVLAARVEFAEFRELGWPSVWVFLAIQFIARPVKTFASTLGSSLTWSERALIGWIAPRGIVAAAISALFAMRLEQAGYEKAHLLVPLTFLVIIGTVVLQSITARPVAKFLGVAEPEPKGFLFIGANQVARSIAKELVEKGYRAVLADTSWDNISKARMEGLRTYFGNPISEHADRYMDLVGIGRMLAVSPQKDLNTLSSLHFRVEFGRDSIFTLQTTLQKYSTDKHQASPMARGNMLFGEEVTHAMLASLMSKGHEIRSTLLSDNFNWEEYKEKHKGKAIPLFAIDTKERLHIFLAGKELAPQSGWVVLSLLPADEENGTKAPPKNGGS